MIEVVRSRLDARERHRWEHALAKAPILAEEGVTLGAAGWSTSFRGAIDSSMLAPLSAPRVAGEGYREGPWVVVGPEVRAPRLSRRTRSIAWVVTIAVLGAVAGHAARAVRQRGAMPRGNQASDVAPPTAHMPSRTRRF